MKIVIICIGKLKEKYLKDAVSEYEKRMSPYAGLEIWELAEEKAPENLSLAEMEIVKEKEGRRILSKLSQRDYVAALDLAGSEMTSEEFSKLIDRHMQFGGGKMVFIIGGSLGLSSEVTCRADIRLSFSKMTLPHQLVRVVLLEQIYRGFKILRGEPYHK